MGKKQPSTIRTWQPGPEDASRTVGRIAGYCWEPDQGGRGRCTRRPHADGQHVDYYNGKKAVTDMEGFRWTS